MAILPLLFASDAHRADLALPKPALMNTGLRGILSFMYALLEQFVFLVAMVVSLICWATTGNVYIAVSVFILIGVLFLTIPSLIKRQKK